MKKLARKKAKLIGSLRDDNYCVIFAAYTPGQRKSIRRSYTRSEIIINNLLVYDTVADSESECVSDSGAQSKHYPLVGGNVWLNATEHGARVLHRLHNFGTDNEISPFALRHFYCSNGQIL